MKNTTGSKGYSIIELVIVFSILSIIAAIAIPSYYRYKNRTYYSQLVQATIPYRVAIATCAQRLKKLTGCDAGKQGIPVAITTPKGPIHSLSVAAGVITVTPVEYKSIVSEDTYILTPVLNKDGKLTWTTSGQAVKHGYAY